MLIGELASAAGTTIRALRYYEQQGLLHPRRAPNGYREFDESAAALVGNIKLLLSRGLTTDDVRLLLPCLDQDLADQPLCPESAHVVERRLAGVEEKIAALDLVRSYLTAALSRLSS